jgi:hypothetical protein
MGNGWRSIHSIPVGVEGTDIDHLAIGPAGVFSVNTKNHPRGNVWIAGRTCKVNFQHTDYVHSAESESRRAARLLTQASGFGVRVRPVLAVLTDKLTIKQAPREVHVIRGRRLADWLLEQPVVLDDDEVMAIFEVARRGETWVDGGPAF